MLVLTPPPNSPPYEESTSPPVQTAQSTQSNPVQSLIREQSTQSNQVQSLIHGLQPEAPAPALRGVAAGGGQTTKMKTGELLGNTHRITKEYYANLLKEEKELIAMKKHSP